MTNRPMQEIILRRGQVTLPSGATALEALRTTRHYSVGAVPITDARGPPLGIPTGRNAVLRMLAENRAPTRTTLADVMTPKPETVGAKAKATGALRSMQDRRVGHLPAVEGRRLLGAVSPGDFRGPELARLDGEPSFGNGAEAAMRLNRRGTSKPRSPRMLEMRPDPCHGPPCRLAADRRRQSTHS